MSRLPITTLNRLYRMCVEVTNNPYFGLTVARYIHISNLHALGYALAASATLMDFCRRLERYFRLVSRRPRSASSKPTARCSCVSSIWSRSAARPRMLSSLS